MMLRQLLVLAGLLLFALPVYIQPAQAQVNAPVVPDEKVRWDGQSRINILVMGMDRRPGARDNLNARTDAMFVVSYAPQQQQLGILHIPRDMHFSTLDAESLVRVNTLLVRGESRAEGYGPYYAMETIQNNLGMYIDAYVAFDFEAFITFIDYLDGITVDVPYYINDTLFPDMNYGYDPLQLSPGVQTFDGYTALQYARTRHGDNDYLRGQRQMQVMLAVRDELSSPSKLQALVVDAPSLFNSLDGHVYTNLRPETIVYIGMSMMLLDRDAIVTGALDKDFSHSYIHNGETVRVPDRELLANLLTQVFGTDYWR